MYFESMWNDDKRRCECKKRCICEKDYIWNPDICSCENTYQVLCMIQQLGVIEL